MKYCRVFLLLLIAGLCSSVDSIAQKVAFSFTVLDDLTNAPLNEVLITCKNSREVKISQKTNPQGRLDLVADFKPGEKITITASKSGEYQEKTISHTITEYGKASNTFTIRLQKMENQDGWLVVDTTFRSIYSEPNFGDQLYRYAAEEEVESKIRAMCKAENISQDFELVASNVGSVAVINTASKRYLLYGSFFFWANADDPSSQYLVLAHAIAHLGNSHSLNPQKRIYEEIAADEKAGRLLYKVQSISEGLTFETLRAALISVPFGYAEVPLEKRIEAFERGWAIADGQLNLKKSAGIFLNEENISNLPLPRFWLDGTPSVYKDNRNVFRNAINPNKTPTLGKVDEVLQKALKGAGFQQWSYHAVNDGFALITQVEQFDENSSDAKSLSGDYRWRDTPPEENISSILGFFERIIWPRNGHFRFFVFVVSDKDIPRQKTDIVINPKYVGDLMEKGAYSLAPSIAALRFTNTTHVNVMVYEMEVPKSTLLGREVTPPRYQPEKHLDGSGILLHLR